MAEATPLDQRSAPSWLPVDDGLAAYGFGPTRLGGLAPGVLSSESTLVERGFTATDPGLWPTSRASSNRSGHRSARRTSSRPQSRRSDAEQRLSSNVVSAAFAADQGAGVVVALIDSGVDFNHPSLRNSFWLNADEMADGVDNDGNGLVDDLTGWDFVAGDPLPQDELGHGTQMAGLVLHAAPAATIMPLRVVNPEGAAGGLNVASAIRYATLHGADVINLSLSSRDELPGVRDAIQIAIQRGVLVVAAAGNSGASSPSFPASLPGVLAVGAVNSKGIKYSWSNDAGAKGADFLQVSSDGINTAVLGGGTGLVWGTSASAALASGALAAKVAAERRASVPQVTSELVVASPG